MSMELMQNLILNAALLLAMSILLNLLSLHPKEKKKSYDVEVGIIIGIVGIFLMLNTVNLTSEVIFDTRSILVSTTGLLMGAIPTLIAVLIISLYRMMIGGAGAFTGVLVTAVTAGIGLVWRQLRLQRILQKNQLTWLEFYLFGWVTHLAMLACMVTLPRQMVSTVLEAISLPILLVYPIVTVLICLSTIRGLNTKQTEIDLKESDLRFRTMFEQAPIGIAFANVNGLLFVNRVFEMILGRTEAEITALRWQSYTHPDDLQSDLDQFHQLIAGQIHDYTMNKRFLKPDGSAIWVHMTVVSLINDPLQEKNYLCMIQDITDMMKAEVNLKESRENYKNLYLEYEKKQTVLLSLFDSIPDLIFYKDIEGRYLGCNQAFAKFTGKEESKIIGLTDYDLFDQKTAELFRTMDQAMMMQKGQRKNEEFVTYPDGRQVYLDTLKTLLFAPDGNLMGLIGVSRDITERKQKEEEILFLNYHDVLTGLYNRTFFDQELKRLDTAAQLPLSVIIADIDGLKLINDAFGHTEGDQLLIEIANILRTCCRPQDIIARTGGDEFSILLPKLDYDQAKMIYDQIKRTCEEYAARTDKTIYYTSISLGYATKTSENEAFEKVYNTAEEHMSRRKLLAHKSLHSAIISSIKTTMFEKSNETEEHAERLADLSKRLGRVLGLNEEELVSLELASTLHDIGKISIDRNILTKPGRLTTEEMTEIKKHPEVGYRIAQTVPELSQIAEYILCHHERWDGFGYPQGLRGEEIPLLSRILAVVDSYDAMTQDRAYRKAMPKEAAIQEIAANAGTQFDPKVAGLFIEILLHDAVE